MENLQEVGNEEDVESISEGSSHLSTLPMEHSPRASRDYAFPLAGFPFVIQCPTIQANNFEIKLSLCSYYEYSIYGVVVGGS